MHHFICIVGSVKLLLNKRFVKIFLVRLTQKAYEFMKMEARNQKMLKYLYCCSEQKRIQIGNINGSWVGVYVSVGG